MEKNGDILGIDWCRISSINSSFAYLFKTLFLKHLILGNYVVCVRVLFILGTLQVLGVNGISWFEGGVYKMSRDM